MDPPAVAFPPRLPMPRPLPLRPALLVLALVGAGAGEAPLAAQERSDPVRVWAGVGFAGAGGTENEGGGGVMGQLVYQRGHHHLALRGLLLVDFLDSTGSVGELGVLYGRTFIDRWGHMAVAAGIAGVDVERGSGSEARTSTGVGIPVVAEAAIQTPVLGVGLQLFGTLHTGGAYAGLAVFLQLGWMP